MIVGDFSQVPSLVVSVLYGLTVPVTTGATVLPAAATALRSVLFADTDPRLELAVTVTVMFAPISPSTNVYEGEISPEIADPFLFHWYWSVSG